MILELHFSSGLITYCLCIPMLDMSYFYYVLIVELPGARSSNIALTTMAALSYAETYHLVIVAGGINDMSKLVYHPSKHALPRFGNPLELIDQTMMALRTTLSKIRAIADIPVILATFPGMDLASYSPAYADLLRPLQPSFNKAVIEVNNQIHGIN